MVDLFHVSRARHYKHSLQGYSLPALLSIVLAGFVFGPGPVARASLLCSDGECQPAISKVVFGGRPAYRITDGRSEAVVVPAIGRIMRYGLVGGPNLLWNARVGAEPKYGSWVNYGGDKSWLGPQSSWSVWHARSGWPPDAALDGQTGAEVEVLSGGKLRLTTPLSAATGIRISRELSFDARGDLVIEQYARKSSGEPIRASIWSVTQAVPGEDVYLPLNPNSPYKKNFHWLVAPKEEESVEAVTSTLLRIRPEPNGGSFKIGVDSPVSAIASVRDQIAFVQRATHTAGEYPDGADGAGFPVELYVNGDRRTHYMEMELLSPLLPFRSGTRWKYTVHWSLHSLPSPDLDSPESLQAIDALLQADPAPPATKIARP